jgi:hypothetical protein
MNYNPIGALKDHLFFVDWVNAMTPSSASWYMAD